MAKVEINLPKEGPLDAATKVIVNGVDLSSSISAVSFSTSVDDLTSEVLLVLPTFDGINVLAEANITAKIDDVDVELLQKLLDCIRIQSSKQGKSVTEVIDWYIKCNSLVYSLGDANPK